MGNCCCRPFGLIRRYSSRLRNRKIVLLLVGLDNAGKSSAAKGLSKESVDDVTPTVGFNVVKLFHRGYSVLIYDLGGGPQIRDIWKRYFADVHGVIFVVDASDRDRLDECKKVFEELLINEYLAGKPVLLLANKQDKPGALDELDIVEKLSVERLVNMQQCPTLVETCAAVPPVENGKRRKLDPGIDNGYRWLLRRVITNYDALNKRVLADQEIQNAVIAKERAAIKKRIEERNENETTSCDSEADEVCSPHLSNPFKPINVLVKKLESNSNGEQRLTVVNNIVIPKNTNDIIDLEYFKNGASGETNVNAVDAVREQLRQKSAGQRKKRQILKKNNRTAPTNEQHLNGQCVSQPEVKQSPAELPPIRQRSANLPWAHIANGKPQNAFAWELDKTLEVVLPPPVGRCYSSGGSDTDDVISGFR